MRDVALTAMTAIQEIIDADTNLSAAVRSTHIGVKDLSDYHGALPAIGIAYTRTIKNDEGQETVEGFCEVVAAGERKTAETASRLIGSGLYELLKTYRNESSLVSKIQGVDTSGFQPINMDTGSLWVCLTHVFWTVEI